MAYGLLLAFGKNMLTVHDSYFSEYAFLVTDGVLAMVTALAIAGTRPPPRTFEAQKQKQNKKAEAQRQSVRVDEEAPLLKSETESKTTTFKFSGLLAPLPSLIRRTQEQRLSRPPPPGWGRRRQHAPLPRRLRPLRRAPPPPPGSPSRSNA